MNLRYNLVLVFFTLLSVTSCQKHDFTESNYEENSEFTINIPEGFDYSTYQTIKINIEDNSNYAKYDIYGFQSEQILTGHETFENEYGEIVTEPVYKNDILNKLIFSGVPKNGLLNQSVNIPHYYKKVYIRRNEGLNYSSSIVDINNKEVNYIHTNTFSIGQTLRNNQVNDYLFCVNGAGELFQVDPLNGILTYLSDMPMGSYTCAIDQENKTLYSIGRSSPYPLMKYSIENNAWETINDLGIGGPRLDYNQNDNLLYFSKNDQLYTFDPTNGTNINTWTINGLHNTNGGDLAFAEDGTLYLCTFSGLYVLELNENNEYDSTRISADNLPFQPTSMTFDSNQELWLANNANSSDLIIMDTQTGGWQYQYGVSAGNIDYGRTINDLTTFKVLSENQEETDTDGDGIIDRDDSYPNDSNKAFEVFTPSKYGTGTIAFEDLWPSNGDYDFNDLALNYQAIAVLNSQNLVVQVDFICNIKSNLAGFTNGIGIEIEGIEPSQIENVSGTLLTQGYINLNSNGTELNQENAVIIFTDDANSLLNETLISITFSDPITTEELGTAPFNPFIIANKTRENEIHLPYHNTTSLGQNIIEINGQNNDYDGNYISANGLPWAISIIHDFKVPKERIRIDDAYNHFNQWATSGGMDYQDWYKDNPGYRNEENIEN